MMKNNKLGSLFWILLVVCILNIVGHLAVYPALPDTVPIHWGASGEVNGWSSKQSNLIFCVLPLAMLAYASGGSLARAEDMQALGALLRENGWTWLTALNAILFSLMHWPCSTTLLSIARETRSVKWPLVGALLPTLLGAAICALTAFVARALGLAA